MIQKNSNMENQTPQPAQQQPETGKRPVEHKNELGRVLGVVIIALLVLGGLYMIVKSKTYTKNNTYAAPSATQVQPSPSPTPLPPLGTVSITSLQQQATVGKPLQVVVKGDTQGKAVVGFDILITYDPALLTVGQITPLDRSFEISSFTKRKGEISVTGTKLVGGTASNALVNAALLNVSFNPLKAGPATVELKEAIGNERTKFVDGQNAKYSPELGSFSFTIL
jgi:hypothetical protein